MLKFSDFSLAVLSIFIVFYLFVSFKVAVSLVIATIITLCGVSVVFDFKLEPVKTKVVQSKFSKKQKVKHTQDLEQSQDSITNRVLNFLNFNLDESFKMNNSFSVLGRSPSFKTKSPKRRNTVGRSHSFSFQSSNVPQKHKLNQSFMSSTGPLLTLPFLPRVKRALGLDNEPSPRKVPVQSVPSYTSHPSTSSPGFLPAVRLGRREKYNLAAVNSSMVRSPNTVKIAPPELHRLSTPRLLEVRNTSQTLDKRRTVDTQAVVSALKEKSKKRTMTMNEETFNEYPVHQAKRRRQESQQSNASTSSLPPLPDNLPDLSTTGYTIPRLETPTLKRSAELSEHDWEEHLSASKRLRKDNRNNSIISSLSSMKRVEINDGERQVKRKGRCDEKENLVEVNKQAKQDKPSKEKNTSISMDRSDTVILPPDFDQSIDQHSMINESNLSDTSSVQEGSEVQPKVQKRVSLNQTFSARKRQMSLYSSLNKSFQKVPQANVLASMDDYEQDREAEQQRVQDMLKGIDAAEKEKQKKAAEEKAKEQTSLLVSTTNTSTAPSSGINTSSIVTSTAPNLNNVKTLTSTNTSSTSNFITPSVPVSSTATSIHLSTASASISSSISLSTTTAATTQQQFSFKPVFGEVTSTSASSATGASSLGGFTFSSGTSQGTPAPPTSSVPQNISSESSGLKFNFATVKSSSTTQSPTKSTNASINAFASTGISTIPQGIGNTAVSNFGVIPGSNTSTTMSTTTMPSTGGFGGIAPSGFNFGNTVTSGASAAFTSNTGTSSTTTSSNSSGFSFGNNQLPSAPAFGKAPVGSSTTVANTTGLAFAFGQNSNKVPVPTSSVFGNNSTVQAAPAFGSSTTNTGGFNFGTISSTTNANSGFSFPGNNVAATNTGSIFGTATNLATSGFGTTSSSSVFGQNPPPAYGSQNPSLSTQSFTGHNPTSQTSALSTQTFGGHNSTTQISVFGAPQNSITSSAPFFGGNKPVVTTSSASVFGNIAQTTSANTNSFNFGGSSSQASMFQGATTQVNQNSIFGGTLANQTSNFSFGGTQGNKQNPGFGNVQQSNNHMSPFGSTAPFGQEKATSVFGTNPSTTQGAFGGSSATAFGGATTTQQSGATPAFGGVNSTASSATPSGNAFAFGGSTPVKSGFDFSRSAGGSASGFNFSANTSFGTPGGTNPTPSFGTPNSGIGTAPPGFSTPTGASTNMFSIGSSNTSARQRIVTKAKRRGTTGRR